MSHAAFLSGTLEGGTHTIQKGAHTRRRDAQYGGSIHRNAQSMAAYYYYYYYYITLLLLLLLDTSIVALNLFFSDVTPVKYVFSQVPPKTIFYWK